MKGIEGSMTLLHGSQGCATYMRRTVSEHYNEPVDVASTSLNEKGTVFGGEENLKKGLQNVSLLYEPQIIGVLTTCLAETIGEDIQRITGNYLREKKNTDFPIINVATPGYGGTHSEGYACTVYKIVATLAEESAQHDKINVLVPHISATDLREIKRLLTVMELDFTLLPDYSDTLDAPYSKPYRKIPDGGTKIKDIRRMPGARATIEIGVTAEDSMSAGKYLEKEFGVPLLRIPLPVGMDYTDILFQSLKQLSGKEIPLEILNARGRLLDGMFDSHKHNAEGRAAIFGEPEQVLAATKICLENGILPRIMATGSRTGKADELLLNELVKNKAAAKKYVIMSNTDFSHILDKCKEMDINLAIGHSEGKILSERAEIPLVRFGFPVHDRVGGQRIFSVGYDGSLSFLDRITNMLLENKYKNYRTEMYEKYYEVKAR